MFRGWPGDELCGLRRLGDQESAGEAVQPSEQLSRLPTGKIHLVRPEDVTRTVASFSRLAPITHPVIADLRIAGQRGYSWVDRMKITAASICSGVKEDPKPGIAPRPSVITAIKSSSGIAAALLPVPRAGPTWPPRSAP